jgi:hypothetical protein
MTYAIGRKAVGLCDVCGQRYKLFRLKPLVVKRVTTATLACPSCWVPDQPQHFVGERPVVDVEALKNPRPDNVDDSRVITAPDRLRTAVSAGVIDVISPLGGTITNG